MLSPRKPSLLAYVNVSLERPQYLGDGPEYCTKGQNRLRTGYNVRKTAVYALGGNALQSPGGGSQDAAEVLARVMSDVIDLLEKDWSVVLTPWQRAPSRPPLGDGPGAIPLPRCLGRRNARHDRPRFVHASPSHP